MHTHTCENEIIQNLVKNLKLYICIHKLSRWLTFRFYLTIPTHINAFDNSCPEKSYWMLHKAGVDHCHENMCRPLGDYVSNNL